MEFEDVFENELDCKLEVLLTVYTRFPLTGFMLVYAFGSRLKKMPGARYELEFRTSTEAQLLNTKRFRAELYSTYGENVVVSHFERLFVE
jgi:hypothetical protein